MTFMLGFILTLFFISGVLYIDKWLQERHRLERIHDLFEGQL